MCEVYILVLPVFELGLVNILRAPFILFYLASFLVFQLVLSFLAVLKSRVQVGEHSSSFSLLQICLRVCVDWRPT